MEHHAAKIMFFSESTELLNLFSYFFATKVAIIGEIWKSRAKLLRNRLFEKIASVTG